MTVRTRVARSAATLVIAAATLVGITGCTFITPTATLDQYDPSEGSSVVVGDITVRNALLLPSDDGSVMSLVMSVFNSAADGAEVLFQAESGGAKIDTTVLIDGGAALSFGSVPGQRQLLIEGVDAPEGSLVPVYVQYGTETGKIVRVPVLNPAQPDYEGLRPTPTPTPTPTMTPAPEIVETPAPEDGTSTEG